MSDTPDLTTLAGQRAHYAAVQRRLMGTPQRVEPAKSVVLPSPGRPTAMVRDRRVPDMVMSIVCNMSGVSRPNLLSRNRVTGLMWPRHIAIYLTRISTKLSLRNISALFGSRVHYTALHSTRTVEHHLVASNPEIKLAVNAVRYCRETRVTADIFEDCLRRAVGMLLDAYKWHVAVRNASWSERIRNNPRPRREGGKYT